MNEIRGLLQDADPVRHESLHLERRDAQRRAMIATAASERPATVVAWQSRGTFVLAIATIVVVGVFVGQRLWSPLVPQVDAAVRFEVRLAEDAPGPELSEVQLSGKARSIYLHEEVVVTNSDISTARVIHFGDLYSVGIEFNTTGASKMRAATRNHIGKPLAIILDGQVVMAPVLRAPIDGSAEITDGFTKAQAEKIANGIIGTP